jgi:single-stranded-DNA-specific exonuclease
MEGRRTEIALRFGLSGTPALLLAVRFPDDEGLAEYLDPSRVDWPDPLRIPDLGPAAERVARAVTAGERVFVHGDYDVDGLMGAAVLVGALRSFGAAPEVFIPSRFEGGYGLSESSVAAALSASASMVLTTDCGTNAREAGEALQRHGVDLVVTDHHVPAPEQQPPGWVVNPHMEPGHPDRALCGTLVALQLVRRVGDLLARPLTLEPFIRLGAIATVADVSPLTPLNRRICREGFAALSTTPNLALARMFKAAGANGRIMGHHIAYHIAPRFNAAGRVEDARLVLDLLLERDPARAAALSGRIEGLNRRRRALQAVAYDDASARAREAAEAPVLFVASGRWHRGVLGPVAARLAESFRKSAFVVSVEGGIGTGSARSWGGENVVALLERCSGLLLRYGGHGGAAGFSVEAEKIPALEARLAIEASQRPAEASAPCLYVPILPEDVPSLWEAWEVMDPFGPLNDEPTVGIEGLYAKGCRVLNGKHLLWEAEAGDGQRLNVIAWDGLGRGLSPSSLTPSALVICKPAPEQRPVALPFYLNVLDIC